MASNTSSPNPGENPAKEKLTKLLVATDGAAALLYCAREGIGPDAGNPEFLRVIAETLVDVAVELQFMADDLAAGNGEWECSSCELDPAACADAGICAVGREGKK